MKEQEELLKKIKEEQNEKNTGNMFENGSDKSKLTWSFEIMEQNNRDVKTTMNTLENIAVNKYIQYWQQNQHYNPMLPL